MLNSLLSAQSNVTLEGQSFFENEWPVGLTFSENVYWSIGKNTVVSSVFINFDVSNEMMKVSRPVHLSEAKKV